MIKYIYIDKYTQKTHLADLWSDVPKSASLFVKKIDNRIDSNLISSYMQLKILHKSEINNSAIFFDSGTFNGYLEIRVSDINGKSLLYLLPELKNHINIKGNLSILNSTNNFGENLSGFLALLIAKKKNFKYIAGDSSLFIFYICNKFFPYKSNKYVFFNSFAKEYIKSNINVKYINRAYNPADIGRNE